MHDSHARRFRDAGSLTTETQIYLSGTSKVALVAMGRLENYGHTFKYSGHSLELGVLA